MRPARHRLAVGIASIALALALAGCLGCGGGGTEAGRHLVVSVGDSVASGEGNPMRGLPRWLDPSWCHRSPKSGQAVAANELIASHPGRSLQYVSFACSGATIDAGLLGPFKRGIFNRAEPAQLDRVRGLLEQSTVDALMISVGANDVGFSKIVTYCAIHDRCEDKRTFGPAVDWAEANHVPPPTLSDYAATRIAQLRNDYGRVDAAIPSDIDRSHVIIVEYFDPTRWPTDTECPIFDERVIQHPEDGLVDPQESRWAHDHVLIPLNNAIKAAAAEYGWTLVDGVDEAFNGHGICAPPGQRWVRTINESFALQQDYLGTLHPNEAGHLATAELIRPKLAAVLGLSPN